MIDIETDILKIIVNNLVIPFPNITVYGEQQTRIAKFPCVVMVEQDNYAYDKTQDSGNLENHAVVTYEVSIYSNRANGKKDECKRIHSVIDSCFAQMGFTRITSVNMTTNDATVYRIVARYTAVVSKNKEIYRR